MNSKLKFNKQFLKNTDKKILKIKTLNKVHIGIYVFFIKLFDFLFFLNIH